MKLTTALSVVAISVPLLAACGAAAPTDPQQTALENDFQKQSYSYGASSGLYINNEFMRQQSGTSLLDKALVIRGFADGLAANTLLSEDDIDSYVTLFNVHLAELKRQEHKEKAQANLAAGVQYLAENSLKPGVQVTASGLQYEILQQGSGASPSGDDVVRVHYHGTLVDASTFDSSYEKNTPLELQVGTSIPGWAEAMQLMTAGSKYRLASPPELAYGSADMGPIPPNSVLLFDVELLDIIKQ